MKESKLCIDKMKEKKLCHAVMNHFRNENHRHNST